MNTELLNKTINEISPKTLVEWYNVTLSNLETIQNKLDSANDLVCLQISQMALSDDFIRDFQDKLNWSWITANHPLKENFIEEFKDFVDWDAVSQHQNLSEEFIRGHQNKVNWRWISIKQTL